VTSQGSAHGRFTRAIAAGNVGAAEIAARELGHLALADAFALTLLLRSDPGRYERAAIRWHGRFSLEATTLTLAESQLALAALGGLRGPAAEQAARAVADVALRHGVRLPRRG
jgi:hypothetical protein